MEISLIFPTQLFAQHPALELRRRVVLIEDSLSFGHDRRWPLDYHRQRLVLLRAAMQNYQSKLTEQGYQTEYIHAKSGKSLTKQLAPLFEQSLSCIHLCDPVDDLLTKRLNQLANAHQFSVKVYPSPAFLSPENWLDEILSKQKRPFMATFYKHQRKRLRILVDDQDEPVGGQWSFDEDNRKKFPKSAAPPTPLGQNPSLHTAEENAHIQRAKRYVDKNFPAATGADFDPAAFVFPISHRAAEHWLTLFLEQRLALFGDYEDAITTRSRTLYHSQLTPMLNIGLLTPEQVIQSTLQFAEEHEVPLNSLEGFIRQIIGWREFMRAMYRLHGAPQRQRNFWNFENSMPPAFYQANTGIPPVDDSIKHAMDHAYCHHIERLMVLGSFMLLCRIHPNAVYQWFMEFFIDAHDWVMVPNVYGMSQFADGGLFTTKPYLCGSNYIRKMSDYPSGDWCQIWDGLYWSFIADYHDVFAKNHRMSMMARSVQRMDADKLATHQDNAARFLKQLGL